MSAASIRPVFLVIYVIFVSLTARTCKRWVPFQKWLTFLTGNQVPQTLCSEYLYLYVAFFYLWTGGVAVYLIASTIKGRWKLNFSLINSNNRKHLESISLEGFEMIRKLYLYKEIQICSCSIALYLWITPRLSSVAPTVLI